MFVHIQSETCCAHKKGPRYRHSFCLQMLTAKKLYKKRKKNTRYTDSHKTDVALTQKKRTGARTMVVVCCIRREVSGPIQSVFVKRKDYSYILNQQAQPNTAAHPHCQIRLKYVRKMTAALSLWYMCWLIK